MARPPSASGRRNLKLAKKLFLLLLLAMLASFFVTLLNSSRTATYEVVDLGVLRKDHKMLETLLDINEIGQVLVHDTKGSESKRLSFIRNPDGSTVDLTDHIKVDFEATKMDERGAIAGTYESETNESRPFVWDITTGFKDIEVPVESRYLLTDFEGDGQLAGIIWEESRYGGAFRWEPLNGLQTFSRLKDEKVNSIQISTKTTLVAHIEKGEKQEVFQVNLDGQIQRISELRNSFTLITDVNNAGAIIGCTDEGSIPSHAVVWSSSGTKVRLTNADHECSMPLDINDKGEIVGFIGSYSQGLIFGLADDLQSILSDESEVDLGLENLVYIAAFWKVDGQMTALNESVPRTSGWTFQCASAINNRGEIVGTGLYQGEPHAFLLIPKNTED